MPAATLTPRFVEIEQRQGKNLEVGEVRAEVNSCIFNGNLLRFPSTRVEMSVFESPNTLKLLRNIIRLKETFFSEPFEKNKKKNRVLISRISIFRSCRVGGRKQQKRRRTRKS